MKKNFLAVSAIVIGILIIVSTDELELLIPKVQNPGWYTYSAALLLVIGALMMAMGICYLCGVLRVLKPEKD